MSTSTLNSQNRPPIIYSGQGAAPEFTSALETSLRQEEQYPLKLDASYIARNLSPESFSLLCIGGGNAIEMTSSIERASGCTCKIKEFVFNGGPFLGICAGAILTSKRYFNGKPYCGIQGYNDFPLDIYPGKIYGFELFKGDYPSKKTDDWQKTVRASSIKMLSDGHEMKCLWNLGPYFDPTIERQQMIACYEDAENKPPAIVHTKFGRGSLVLSGVHPEAIYYEKIFAQLPCASELQNDEVNQRNLIHHLIRLAQTDQFTSDLQFQDPKWIVPAEAHAN